MYPPFYAFLCVGPVPHAQFESWNRASIVSTVMIRNLILMTSLLSLLITAAGAVVAQRPDLRTFVPVTEQMLANPSPDDWLMYSRTYDAQRFSPLNQINKQNAGQLRLAWTRGMTTGTTVE